MILQGTFFEHYFDDIDYENIDDSRLGRDIRLVKRSNFNTAQEIRKYEALNAQQDVKIIKLKGDK
jgi:hypothetical protein